MNQSLAKQETETTLTSIKKVCHDLILSTHQSSRDGEYYEATIVMLEGDQTASYIGESKLSIDKAMGRAVSCWVEGQQEK